MVMNMKFPELIKSLHKLNFTSDDGIDFEPYDEFLSEDETIHWFKAWTGNKNIEKTDLLVFGQDGTGGLAAIWNTVPDSSLLEQPIVFFGSVGELGIIAKNFHDYLWLLASGHGPYEAVSYPDDETEINSQFMDFAKSNSQTEQRCALSIIEEATNSFPEFTNQIELLCR